MEVRTTTSQFLVIAVTLYNLFVIVTRLLQYDIGRVDDLNNLADLILYYDLALTVYHLFISDGEPRPFLEIKELLVNEGFWFMMQVTSSLDTNTVADVLAACHVNASYFRFIRGIRLLTIPIFVKDFFDEPTFINDLTRLWLPVVISGFIIIILLAGLDSLISEFPIQPLSSPFIMFSTSSISVLGTVVLNKMADKNDLDADSETSMASLRPSILVSRQESNRLRDLFLDHLIVSIEETFGEKLVNESDGKGSTLGHVIARKFRVEMLPPRSELDLSGGPKRLYVLVQGSLKGYITADKTEMIRAPKTFGNIFSEPRDDQIKLLVSRELSKVYSLDESVLQELQRVYPALGISIQLRLKQQALKRDVEDVTSAFTNGITYCFVIFSSMLIVVAIFVRVLKAHEDTKAQLMNTSIPVD